jgi:hypothetical protein
MAGDDATPAGHELRQGSTTTIGTADGGLSARSEGNRASSGWLGEREEEGELGEGERGPGLAGFVEGRGERRGRVGERNNAFVSRLKHH